MVDDVFGELFIDDDSDDGSSAAHAPLMPPVTVPEAVRSETVAPNDERTAAIASQVVAAPTDHEPDVRSVPEEGVKTEAASEVTDPAGVQDATEADDAESVLEESEPTVTRDKTEREQLLADALNRLMDDSRDVQATALVSLDGFIMASALPAGLQEDRVGAMSAAILGLGERAAAELGQGRLSQVFIEGDEGFVLLMAAGERAVLTCLADKQAKPGLVIFDMRAAADEIAQILG